MNKTKAMVDYEVNNGIDLRAYFEEEYHVNLKTFREISAVTGIKQPTMKSWFTRLGISTRSTSDAAKLRYKGTSIDERRELTANARIEVSKAIDEGSFWLGGRAAGTMSQEEKAAISLRMTINNPMHNEENASKMRKSMESVLRDRATPQELKVKQELKARGIPFKFQHAVGRAILDFADIRNKLGIEIDGIPHYTNSLVKSKDDKRDSELIDKGWRILRITNYSVDNDVTGVVDEIERWL